MAAPSESLGASTSELPDLSLPETVGTPGPVLLETASPTPPGPPESLAEALVALFNEADFNQPASEVLRDLFATDVQWTMPLFDVQGLSPVMENFDSLRTFILDARIQILEGTKTEGGEAVEWLFSFVYPLPWRPRVTMSGRSTTSLNANGSITRI